MNEDSGPWTTLGSRVVYRNDWCTMREDQVLRPDGTPGVYGVLELPGSIGVVAVDGEGRVVLVRQWRYVQGRYSVEIPGGSLGPGEEPIVAAARELVEETGLIARSWRELGTIDNSNGIVRDVAHLYLATDVGPAAADFRPDPLEPTEVFRWPLARAVAAAVAGEITESVSVAALLRAELSGPPGDRPVAGGWPDGEHRLAPGPSSRVQ